MCFMIYVILLAAVMLFSYNKFHRIFNITSLFSGIWFVFGALSCLGLYGMRIPSVKVHAYVWLFVLLVDIIIWLFSKKGEVDLSDGAEQADKHKNAARYVSIIAYVLLVPFAVKMWNVLLETRNLTKLRLFYFGGNIFDSSLETLLFKLVPMAMLEALTIYYVLVSFEKKSFKPLLIAIFNTILTTLLNGGRYALILLVYSIVIPLVAGNVGLTKFSYVKKYKKRIKRIAVVVCVAMVLVTVLRGQQLLRSVIVYFSGSLSFLDYILANPGTFALHEPTNGYLTFGAICEPFVLLLKYLDLTNIKVPSYEFNIYCQPYYDIGDGTTRVMFNANTSVIYYFLRDFGAWGIVLGAVLLGAVTVYAYNKWKAGSRFFGAIFIYMGYVLFNSLMTYSIFGTTPMFMAITFFFIAQRKFAFGSGKTIKLKR